MEREPGKKQTFEQLSSREQDLYYKRATYLIDKGYIIDKNIEEVARDIYNAKWRK